MRDVRHDPLSVLLNARLGFRAGPPPDPAKPLVIDPECCALVLPRVLPHPLALDEPNGSLGGVRLPSHVAQGPSGDIYLLDRRRSRMKHFDPCCCRFDEVPCLGGVGRGPRDLPEPRSIAIGCGRLHVVDRDRVAVFALKGFGLIGELRPRPDKLPWEPMGVGVDSLGRAWVADHKGFVHRFTPHGRWERSWSTPAPAVHLAIDGQDRVYLVMPGASPAVLVLDRDGRAMSEDIRGPHQLRSRFPKLRIPIDADGRLFLEPCCDPASIRKTKPTRELWFDQQGDPWERDPVSMAFETEGTFRTLQIDSGIAQCVWHRVVLAGALPQGTCIRLSAFTTDELLDPATLVEVGEWKPFVTATAFDDGRRWDCLLSSPPGRYLALQVRCESTGTATPAIRSIELEFPRISLRRYLPAVFGAEPASGDFTDRFLALFDTTLRGIERCIDELPHLFDPASAPATTDSPRQLDYLSWLGTWSGVALDRNADASTRRRLLMGAGARLDRRGTLGGLTEQLQVLLGFDRLVPCTEEAPRCGRCLPPPLNCAPAPRQVRALPPLILEHFRLRRWLRVGCSQLDQAWVLWGEQIVNRTRLGTNGQLGVTRLDTSPDPERDFWLVHANQFSVFVPARMQRDDRARKSLENLVRTEAPAGTRGTVHYVEPRFRIGVQAMLGFDAVIAEVPPSLRLGESPLGQGTMLQAPPHLEGAPGIALDHEGRIGTTTLLA